VANLTLALDDSLLRRARVRAAQENTTVNALVRTYLETYATDERRAAAERFAELARASTATSGVRWTREELYAERLERYGPDIVP
jgi:plasmid stability protein